MRHEIGVDASRDLRELHGYGLQKYGGRQADAYLGELFAVFEQIAQWPVATRPRTSAQPPIRLRKHRAHNILYVVQTDTVVILRIFHHSVNWIDIL